MRHRHLVSVHRTVPSAGPVAPRGLDVTVVASRFAPAAKLDRIRAVDTTLELVDGDFDAARERAASLAR